MSIFTWIALSLLIVSVSFSRPICGADGATIVTQGPNSADFEVYSKRMDTAFYAIRLRISAVKNALKKSKMCGGEQLPHFEEQVRRIQQRMKTKFDECQTIHKDGQKHNLQAKSKVIEFKQKYAKSWIMACFNSSEKYVMSALREMELLCKD